MTAIRKTTGLLSVFIFCMVCLFLDCIASQYKKRMPIPSKSSLFIYREVNAKAEPVANHGAVIIDDWGFVPEASRFACMKAFFYTCPTNVFLIVRKSLMKKYLEGENSIYNTDKWLCRASKYWVVFVRKSPELVLFGERAGKKNLPIDARLGINWSLMSPVKDFTNANDAAYKDIGVGGSYDDLEAVFVKDCKGVNWAISMVDIYGGRISQLLYFFDKNLHVKLCVAETHVVPKALVFDKGPLSFPFIASRLFMSQDIMFLLTLKNDQPQELEKFDFAGFFETLQSDKPDEPILLNTLIKKLYGFFDGWLDYDEKNGPGWFAPFIMGAHKTGFVRLVDKNGTPFPIDRKKILRVVPFATHGAIIVSSDKDYDRGPLIDDLDRAFRNVTNAIIIVPAKLIVQYLNGGNKIPSDRWVCRRVPGDGPDSGIEVYVPKSELVGYYGNETSNQKEIASIDAILGVKWSQLEPVGNITEIASHKVDKPADMAKILMEKIFVTPKEYQSYNAQDSAMRLSLAAWSIYIDGHGAPYCGIASFQGKSLFKLLEFFDEPKGKPMAKLVDISACYANPEKFKEFRGKPFGYFLVLRTMVAATVVSNKMWVFLDGYFSIQQAADMAPINLAFLLSQATPFIRFVPFYINIPQIRFPGEADFSPLSLSSDYMVTISETFAKNFGKGKTLDISQYFKRIPEKETKEKPVYPIFILFSAQKVPFKIKISKNPASKERQPLVMASIIPGDVVHQIDGVDATDFTLDELVRAFVISGLTDKKAFIIDKLRVKGSIGDTRDENVISEVKFVFVNYLDLEVESAPSYAYVLVEPISEKKLVTKAISQKRPSKAAPEVKSVGGFFEHNSLESIGDKKIVFTTYDTQEDFAREKKMAADLINKILATT